MSWMSRLERREQDLRDAEESGDRERIEGAEEALRRFTEEGD